MSIGKRLKDERLRLGLTQTQLASLAGVSKGAQINWEKDATSPPASVLVDYAKGGVDIAYVLHGIRGDGLSRFVTALHERKALREVEDAATNDELDEACRISLERLATSPSEWISDSLRARAEDMLRKYYNDDASSNRRAEKFARILSFREESERDLDDALRSVDLNLPHSFKHQLLMLIIDYKIKVVDLLPLLTEVKILK